MAETNGNGNKVTFSWLTSALLVVLCMMGGTGFWLTWNQASAAASIAAGADTKVERLSEALVGLKHELVLLNDKVDAAEVRAASAEAKNDKAHERIEAGLNALAKFRP
jgi:hypothetical protein